MALGIMRGGVPLDQIYGPKGTNKAADFGCKQNGVDISNYLLALADGKALGFNVGLAKAGSDASASFGVPLGNTPLPINGQSYAASAHSATTASVANLVFGTTSGGWALTRTQSPSGSSGTIASGTNPTGSTSVAYNLVTTSGGGTGTSTGNTAPSQTAFSSSPSCSIAANGAPSQPERDIAATLTINYYNSSNNIISTTVIYLSALAVGAS